MSLRTNSVQWLEGLRTQKWKQYVPNVKGMTGIMQERKMQKDLKKHVGG